MKLLGAVVLALGVCAAPALADNAANKARATLRDCLDKIPLDRLSDESLISECLGQAQGAADKARSRDGQVEFNRRLDDLDRFIERTTRGGPRRF